MTVIAWSQRVGEVWTGGVGTVEIVGDNTNARLVKLRYPAGDTDWVPYADLEGHFVQELCETCAVPLTAMRKLLVEEAKRNSPRPSKARPGKFCTKPCCATRHAPKTC